MPIETQVALIGAFASIVLALIPFALQALRLRGLRITEAQEYLINDIVRDGARLAEEYARKRPTTSEEKLEIATRYAQKLLAKRSVKLTYDELAQRIEASLDSALPDRKPPSTLSIPEHLK